MKHFLLVTALIVSVAVNVILISESTTRARTLSSGDTTENAQQFSDQDWDTFIRALAWVESRWRDDAESTKKAVGYLQITPILVEDANRIEGFDSFSLGDRYDRNESIRLFNVIMDNYNPQHDKQFALKIWNPYSKVSYHRAVMRKYEELKKETLI